MALWVESISKRFGTVQAVDNVSFGVPAGRVCGLLGSNGAGKTTTMRMIMRIFLPDEGRIYWDGAPITDESRKGFGYLPEERGLYPKFEVREQLIYLTELKGLPRKEAAVRVDRWIKELEISEYAPRRVEQLSKGNQQKVQFAATVASGPGLAILDEPFTGLDPVNTLIMEKAFRTVAAEGTTVLFSAHNLDQVEALCEDVVLLHRSHVVLAGGLREIKKAARRHTVRLKMEGGDYSFLEQIAGIGVRDGTAGSKEISLPADLDPNLILRAAAEAGPVTEYSLGEPSLREIYLEKVGANHA
ncbi:MAG TPA: ATP-binding cassette domain-containing protein [Symbiobacteriaceae bacterium]|nr:ATP-binding cassette domain-containing protein [Symbiobacteriaceae bacterium]